MDDAASVMMMAIMTVMMVMIKITIAMVETLWKSHGLILQIGDGLLTHMENDEGQWN